MLRTANIPNLIRQGGQIHTARRRCYAVPLSAPSFWTFHYSRRYQSLPPRVNPPSRTPFRNWENAEQGVSLAFKGLGFLRFMLGPRWGGIGATSPAFASTATVQSRRSIYCTFTAEPRKSLIIKWSR